MTTREDLFKSYQLVCEMPLPLKNKVRMMGSIFSCVDNVWRVTGITKLALERFAENDFKKVSKMGINRSHLVDRHLTYKTMLAEPFDDIDEWWNFYWNNDKTVLATSSENMQKEDMKDIIPIDVDLGMFTSSGYAWKHRKQEREFLKELYESM